MNGNNNLSESVSGAIGVGLPLLFGAAALNLLGRATRPMKMPRGRYVVFIGSVPREEFSTFPPAKRLADSLRKRGVRNVSVRYF